MPASQPQSEITTLEQYEALPEDKRVEVFDGVIYDMARPSQIHQTISIELSNIIYNYIKSKKGSCQLFSAPFDVKLSDKPLTFENDMLNVQYSFDSIIKVNIYEDLLINFSEIADMLDF